MTKQTKANGLPVIEKGIPLPPRSGRAENAYTSVFRAMKVGESCALDPKRAMTARTMVLRLAPAKFVSRKQDDGSIRFWRTE